MSTPHMSSQLIAVKPIAVPTTDRDIALEVKITAPVTGDDLPVIVFSHGNAWSMDGYEPLVDRWAAAGFVVVQPTHLDSRRNGIGFGDPRFAGIWRSRIADIHAVLDHLGDVVANVAGLSARVDDDRVAVVGHSWGAQTVGAVLGARVFGADGIADEDFSHPRAIVGALIAATGDGGTLTPFAVEHLPFMRPDFSTMTAPALIIAGADDQSKMSTRGPDWFTDAYHLSPAPKRLISIAGGEHTMGGIAGEAVKETTDEDADRVIAVADAVSGYLLDALGINVQPWHALTDAYAATAGAFTIETK